MSIVTNAADKRTDEQTDGQPTNRKRRTYSSSGGEAAIRKHLFFRHIDWDKIAKKEVQPPFKPRIRDRLDVSNFDRQFTGQKVALSPTDESFMMNLDQSMFEGFSYTNEHFLTDDSDDEAIIIAQIDPSQRRTSSACNVVQANNNNNPTNDKPMQTSLSSGGSSSSNNNNNEGGNRAN